MRFGLFELDPRTGELARNGRKVRLQDQPLRVLTLLLERPGELVTRDELRQRLWPADTFVDFDDGLNAAVRKLRTSLGDSSENPTFIETVPRRGYRFIAPVVAEPSAATATPPTTAALRLRWPALAVAGIIVVTGFALIPARRPPPPGADPALPAIRSIVVLPMKNLSNDPEQQYFADGMTDELITRLAAIEGLRVISRTSAMTFRDSDKLLPRIASELNVDAVVEGSVLRSGDRVRVTAQLIHAATDRHLWAESFERDERDVLALQDAVAGEIARKIRVTLRPAGGAGAGRALDPEAHRAYLRGRHRWHTRRGEELKRAIADFEQAIARDPSYAAAHAGLADVHLVLPFLSGTSQEEAYPRARDAAARALELDPTLAEAHTSDAYVKMYLDWDFAGAERGFRRAIELRPGYATAHQWYAELLSFQGRHEEAVAHAREALELDPLAAVVHHQAAQTYRVARRYDEATQEYEHAIALDPWFLGPSGHPLAWAQARKGALVDAARTMRRVAEGSAAFAPAASALESAAARGDRPAFHRALLASADLYPRPACLRGTWSAALGRDAAALRHLEEAVAQRAECVLYANVDPEWDRLRGDPRFVAALRTIGL